MSLFTLRRNHEFERCEVVTIAERVKANANAPLTACFTKHPVNAANCENINRCLQLGRCDVQHRMQHIVTDSLQFYLREKSIIGFVKKWKNGTEIYVSKIFYL
jgi:hypothetical protein